MMCKLRQEPALAANRTGDGRHSAWVLTMVRVVGARLFISLETTAWLHHYRIDLQWCCSPHVIDQISERMPHVWVSTCRTFDYAVVITARLSRIREFIIQLSGT
jgi:hypothetical protein